MTALVTALAVLAGSLTGGATIVPGTRDDVKVRSSPPGVAVKTDDRLTVTPGQLQNLERNRDHELVFEKDGLPTRETTLESTPSCVEVDMITGEVKEFDDQPRGRA